MATHPFIVVSGPDGSGKTSLTERLANHLHVGAYVELPFEQPEFVAWLAGPTIGSLADAQASFLRHAAQRQIHASATGGVIERGLDDNLKVFCTLARRQRRISAKQYRELCAIYHDYRAGTPQPALTVYLSASYATVLGSIRQRNRDDDQNMADEQLAAQHAAYERWADRHPDVVRCPALVPFEEAQATLTAHPLYQRYFSAKV